MRAGTARRSAPAMPSRLSTSTKCASMKRAPPTSFYSTCHEKETHEMNTLANRGFNQPASLIAPSVADAAALVGRILLAVLFLKSGWGKIGGFDQTAAMMASKGVPLASIALIVTILLELGGGLLLVIGYKARWVGLA